MFVAEQRYCNFCRGVIVFGQKHVQARVPGSEGKASLNYSHYHHRFQNDCWARQLRKEQGRPELRRLPSDMPRWAGNA